MTNVFSELAVEALTCPVQLAGLMTQSGVAFGTSGARGLASAMTDKLCHAYVTAFLAHLGGLGEFHAGKSVALAGDLRDSTPRILAACAAAIRDAGGQAIHCGTVPTPALAHFAFAQGIPAIMVTGSHIPADRNGIKFYRPFGEVLKSDEEAISRQTIEPGPDRFDSAGALTRAEPLPAPIDIGAAYVDRYRRFFGPSALAGLKVGVYQHSAVGRDVLVETIAALGGTPIAFGRSESFVPVDTEATRAEDRQLAREWVAQHEVDAIVSTDGDSDRPMLADHRGNWLRGDIIGLLCARVIGADCVVTPVTSNTAVERCGAFSKVVRTRVGSPFVIEAMNRVLARNPQAVVCGYEANGGFLLCSDICHAGQQLKALPTRDAFLPILAVLADARGSSLARKVASLPQRFTFSDRLADVGRDQTDALMGFLSSGTPDEQIRHAEELLGKRGGPVKHIDQTDGVRITLGNGNIVHLRPSGNAPELRCYAEASSQDEAQKLASFGLLQAKTWLKASS